ncbi:MAG: TIGR04283 family arsenosugar biosynthesis glycosyltransferase [Candidatus Sumerlaeia bacterium]
MKKTLILFTRYPEAGKTKTRLIPAIGAEAAADLHRQLVLRSVDCARQLRERMDVRVVVRHAEDDSRRFRDWLGDGLDYAPQPNGDIGARMSACLDDALQDPEDKAVLIGTDIPGMSAEILERAFERLERKDVVFGPANDGGYYLVGLRRSAPEIFRDIPWSTDAVLEQSLQKAKEAGFQWDLVDALDDIDSAQDLEQVEDYDWIEKTWSAEDGESISIIIPTFNEAASIGDTIAAIRARQSGDSVCEILIADGGSTDETVNIARRSGAKVFEAPSGRGAQMDAAAEKATGGILFFLHADSEPPVHYDAAICRELSRDGVVAGAFSLRFGQARPGLRLMEWGIDKRSRLLQQPYGDQGIFLRRKTFHDVGGYRGFPIMEDLDLVRRLRKKGRMAIAPEVMISSARRYEKVGILRTFLMNQMMQLGYYCGLAPERLARYYYGRR